MESSVTPARTLQVRCGQFANDQARRGGAIHLGDFIENNTTLDAAASPCNGNSATQHEDIAVKRRVLGPGGMRNKGCPCYWFPRKQSKTSRVGQRALCDSRRMRLRRR
jgi:hypothetical protein